MDSLLPVGNKAMSCFCSPIDIIETYAGEVPLDIACANSNVVIARMLLAEGTCDDDGKTALMRVASMGFYDSVCFLWSKQN